MKKVDKLLGERKLIENTERDEVIDDKLGGKKSITDGKIIVDRAINGARGILLKQLNKVA